MSQSCNHRCIATGLAGILLVLYSAAQEAGAGDQPTCGIFVATSGADDATCGLLPTDPCRTISHGLSRAAAGGLSCVFVQAGTYAEAVALTAGVNITGGFDAGWQSGPYIEPDHAVYIGGPSIPGCITINAVGINTPTAVSNVVLRGANGTTCGAGSSSYAVRVFNSSALVLSDLRIEAGNGATGAAGTAGSSASASAAPGGGNGGSGGSVAICDDTPGGVGGGGGVGGCNNGGTGGVGGRADTDCCCTAFCIPCAFSAQSGFSGGVGGSSLGGSPGGGGSTCHVGGMGQPGGIANGPAGAAAAPGGTVNIGTGLWVPNNGGNGGLGQHGGGGGGGGGSGGCDTGANYYGAGGGGGGAGGCRANPGTGGKGGGSSFGVFAVSSTVTLTNCLVVRGQGGAGGAGGAGGQGQPGGIGGNGGAGSGSALSGGKGGNGGHGGHGGGGAGGPGGHSAGVYCANSTITSSNLSIIGGGAGPGGAGGISAPAAPPAIDDGNDGPAGPSGSLIATMSCGAAGSATQPTGCNPLPCVIPPCPADFDGSGFVTGLDLAQLLGAWTGAAAYSPCPPHSTFDLNQDCKVNGLDLAVLLGSWGPCPK